MIVVFIYPFIIILIHTALHVLRTKRSPWAKQLAKWILRSVALILIQAALHMLRSKRSSRTKHLAKWILRSVASLLLFILVPN
jgi:chromate transport protein ChrA